MSFNNLDNCLRCGDLFVLVSRQICPKCVKKVEQEFKICSQFLRNKQKRSSTIVEMSEKTGVSVTQITEFIREKRLLVDMAMNIEYPCEGCGQPIRSNRLCPTCLDFFKTETDDSSSNKGDGSSKKTKSSYHIDR